MEKFKHLMLDIETMGNTSYSAIISIGALEFDIETGLTGKEFLVYIDLQSCLDHGLTVDASTILWWMGRSDESRNDFLNRSPQLLYPALHQFQQFCEYGDYEVWGNSARFDCGILQNAYNKFKVSIPWDFRKERCVRTLVSFNPKIKENFPPMGTKHNALSDCYFQVGYCSAIWNSLKHKP